MTCFIISAGSSCHNAAEYFSAVCKYINNSHNMVLHGMSTIYKNGSQDMRVNHMFYNCALALNSHLEPHAFYRELKVIESNLGRIRSYKNAPRTIDLDVLLSINLSYRSQSFFIPHPEAYKRSFFVRCARELINSLGWPAPLALLESKNRLARAYLAPCHPSM